MTAVNVMAVVLAFVFPWVANSLSRKYSFFEKLGPIVICYLFGIIIGNIGLGYDASSLKNVADAVVPLSIPLFIFGVDFLGWLKHSKQTVISFILVIISVFIVTLTVGFAFGDHVESSAQISGMLAGVYTGGTPNLSAIGKALEVAEETIILVNGVDMATGSIYLAILLVFGNKFLSGFLKVLPVKESEKIDHHEESFQFKQNWIGVLKGFGLSVLVNAVSAGITFAIFKSLNVAFFIFSISFFAGALSFNGKVRGLKGPYEFGHYLLMVFCVAIGGLANINKLMELSFDVALMCSIVVFGAIIIHLLLAKLFKVDRDTAIITSVAGIYGPPFVPLIADRFENKAMIAPGIATGLIGFAIGNYIGLLIYFILS